MSNTVIAVAHVSDKAELLADLSRSAGFACIATTDLGWALDEAPQVLLVDPTGWQSTVRALLSSFDTSTQAPPAVLLVCEDKQAIFEAGPAVDVISIDTDSEKLGLLLTSLEVIQKNFARIWPQQIEIGSVAEVSNVVQLLSERTGIEIRSDKWNTFRTAIKERMVAKLSYSLSEYERRLSGERGRRELMLLASRIVVGETYFWRYSGQMNALKRLLLERRARFGPEKAVKIWSAGCSTGEEVYSVAMAALEVLGDDGDVHVFGTDLNPLHLARAAKGVYAARALRNLPPRLCTRWFSVEGGRYIVDEKLKARVSFEQMNFVGDDLNEWIGLNGPFDSVFCRNVTIYFDEHTTKTVVGRLLGALNEGGGLFRGSAETIFPLPPGISVVHETGAFYYRKSEPEEEQPSPAPSPSVLQPPLDDGMLLIYSEGLELLGREEFAKAGEKFKQLIANDADCPMGKTGMAILLSNQGREVEARKTLTEVVDHGQALAETHFMLGLLDERRGAYDDALVSYKEALAADPAFFMAHFNRAWVLKRLGKKAEFAAEMKGALAVLKSSSKCHSWATGGLGLEAILGLVAEAVEQGSADSWK